MNELKQLFGYYLLYSYAYYERNISIISDDEFNQICLLLLDKWSEWSHRYKSLISQADLAAGTGYAIKYPQRLKESLDRTTTAWENKEPWIFNFLQRK